MYSEFFYLQKMQYVKSSMWLLNRIKLSLLSQKSYFISDLKEATWHIQQLLILLFL